MSEIEKITKQFTDLSPESQKEAKKSLEGLFKQSNKIDWNDLNSRWKTLDAKNKKEEL